VVHSHVCQPPNAGPKIQLKDSLGPSALTESDADENVMSNGNCHGFAGLGSWTGERRHSSQPYPGA